MVGATDAE